MYDAATGADALVICTDWDEFKSPDFARLVREWLDTGGTWDAVIGPSARRRLETVA